MTPDPDRVWELAEKAIGRYPYTLLHGPGGTGKTGTIIRKLRERGENPLNLYITPEASAAEVLGMMVPNEGGGFSYHYGPGALAWTNGWPIVINEIDDATGDAETALLGLLDDPDIAELTLTNGEVIRPKPGFSAVGTMNSDPEALRPVLADRFPIRIRCETIHPAAVETLPEDLRPAVRRAAHAQDERQQSIRPWHAFGIARDEWELTPEEAAFLVWQEGGTDILNQIRMAGD
jgi:MoxR-like ATPase